MNNKFIIIAQPRTGSTLLCWTLSSHPKIICSVEPINPAGHWHPMQPIDDMEKSVPQDAIKTNLHAVLDMIYTTPPIFPIGTKKKAEAIGFKIMIHQILALSDPTVFWDYIINNNITIITVKRLNLLMQYTSDMITLKTSQSACPNTVSPKTAQIFVDRNHMANYLKTIENERKYLDDKLSGLQYINMVYEEFSNNYNLISDLLPKFGMKKVPLHVKLIKQNSDDFSSRVSNIGEFRQIAIDLGYGSML